MNNNRINEEMAKLDWFETKIEAGILYGRNDGCWMSVDCYWNDLNAVHRVLRKASDARLRDIGHELELVCGTKLHPWVMLLKATSAQKCEAILKALGKWEEEE